MGEIIAGSAGEVASELEGAVDSPEKLSVRDEFMVAADMLEWLGPKIKSLYFERYYKADDYPVEVEAFNAALLSFYRELEDAVAEQRIFSE